MDKHYYQVVRKDELQHGLSFKKLGRKTAKYIAKIKKGAKTRYIYTQEELNAYKKQLSNKTKAALGETDRKIDVKKYELAKKKSAAKIKNKLTAKGLYNPEFSTASDYERRKKIAQMTSKNTSLIKEAGKYASASAKGLLNKVGKGKADDKIEDAVKKVKNSDLVKSTKKTVEKGKKKVDKFIKDTKTKANAYGKALSSKDEQQVLDKAKKKSEALDNKLSENQDKAFAPFKASYQMEKPGANKARLKKVSDRDYAVYKKAFSDWEKSISDEDKAKKNLERSKTLKGKAEDVRDTYRQFHPKKKKKKS